MSEPRRITRHRYFRLTKIVSAVAETNANLVGEPGQRTIYQTRPRVLFHQHERRTRQYRRRANRCRRISARAHDDPRTKAPHQFECESNRASEFHRRAHPLDRTMPANSVHLEQLVFVAALRQPFRLEPRAGPDEQHVDFRTLANHFLAERDCGKKMPTRSAAGDYHLHRTAGRRPSASSAPNAAIAMMIEVPP